MCDVTMPESWRARWHNDTSGRLRRRQRRPGLHVTEAGESLQVFKGTKVTTTKRAGRHVVARALVGRVAVCLDVPEKPL